MPIEGSNKIFLLKLAEKIDDIIKASHLSADCEFMSFNDDRGKAPSSSPRRQSLNMVPFSRRTDSDGDSDWRADFDESERIILDETITNESLVYLSSSTEDMAIAVFMEFASMAHSRQDSPQDERVLGELFMAKRNFFAMCLLLDIIDNRLTLKAAKACFEKCAFLSDRGQRKFNNRLAINSFIECIILMAQFKYGAEADDGSSIILKKLFDAMHFARIKDHPNLQALKDTFLDLCHPAIIETFIENQVLLMKAYKRSSNYGVANLSSGPGVSSGTEGSSSLTLRDIDSFSGVIQSFNLFCKNFRIVPMLTREAVITRISMHMSNLSKDGLRFFFGCLIHLAMALSRTDDSDHRTNMPNASTINSVMERLILQVQAHI